jgi:hypothetical protein
MEINGCYLDVRDTVYERGRHPEDGEMMYGTVYQVTLTDSRGNRWIHGHGFDTNEEAMALLDRIEAHGEVNLDHWNECDPAYGSEAWAALDAEGHWVALERKEEEAAAW